MGCDFEATILPTASWHGELLKEVLRHYTTLKFFSSETTPKDISINVRKAIKVLQKLFV